MPPHLEPPRFRPAHAPISLRVGDFRLRRTGIARYDLLRDPYYAAVTAPWWAFGLSALALLLSVNLLFAALFLLRPAAVQNLPAGSLADSFFFSMETMSTVGYGAMAPSSRYGHVVATAEMVVGLGLVASLTGILFVRLSRPRARILFADRPAVNGGGDPVLSIRIANGRRVPSSTPPRAWPRCCCFPAPTVPRPGSCTTCRWRRTATACSRSPGPCATPWTRRARLPASVRPGSRRAGSGCS